MTSARVEVEGEGEEKTPSPALLSEPGRPREAENRSASILLLFTVFFSCDGGASGGAAGQDVPERPAAFSLARGCTI